MIADMLLHVLVISVGILIMAIMLDVRVSFAMVFRKYVGIGILIVIYVMMFALEYFFGDEVYRRSYPLTVQFPILIAFSLLCSYQMKKVFFSFVSAITMMGIPVILTRNLMFSFALPEVSRLLIVAIVGGLLAYCIKHWVAEDIHFVFEKHDQMWWMYIIIPLVYWFGTYRQQHYVISDEYTSQFRFLNIMLWSIMLLSYLLIFRLFRVLHNLYNEEVKERELALQQESVQEGIKQLCYANEQSKIYRHDMRHHFSALHGYLNSNDVSQAKLYLANMLNKISEITPQSYCNHEMLNIVLSSFDSIASEKGITLQIHTYIGDFVPLEDSELCVMVSNALENAIQAVDKIQNAENKQIQVSIQSDDEKLLMEVTNRFEGELCMKKNVPVRQNDGNGYGVASIISVVEKYHGMYKYVVEKHKISLNIVI